MNRRGFFRFLATAVVAAPALPTILEQASLAAEQAHLMGLFGTAHLWEQEFDYRNKVGFAIGQVWDFKRVASSQDEEVLVIVPSSRRALELLA